MSVLLQKQTPADSLAAELNLGPLQEPEALPFTFETIGWPILTVVVFVLIVVIAVLAIRKHIRNKYRREALAKLQEIQQKNTAISDAMVLAKRTAIHAFGREKVGKLNGEAWLQFLDDHAKGVQFMAIKTEVLSLMYKDQMPSDAAREKILTNTKNWINHHAVR